MKKIKTPTTLPPAKTVDELLGQIHNIIAGAGGQVIFRGESENNDFICSSLAQNYLDEIQTEDFNLEKIQEQELKKIKSYTDLEDVDDILSEVRHYGGRTVLIDFAYDYNVALFFACDSEPEEDGRIILINTSKLPKEIKISPPKKRLNIRITSQKSVFLRPFKRNYVYENEGESFITIILVPKELKQEIIIRLDKHHKIKTETIYCDIFGYIYNQNVHQDAETLFHKGYALSDRGDYDGAIVAYTESIQKNPNIPVTYNNRAACHLAKGDYDAAIADCNKSIELDANHALGYFNRGLAYMNKVNYDNAIADFDEYIKHEPKNANDYRNCGFAYFCKEDYDNAIANYEKSLELEPNNADVIKDYEEAKEELEKIKKR